ncbi:helix-turn-helix domain-containing protein [Malaciobacter marinus]|uniref:helix-turn-helix domain-containing protein n=1 Tax=Malaciobacter marinus TaxID=505249 RepID=UPI003AFF6DB2
METAIKQIKKELKIKSQGELAKELEISKATLNLLIKNKYPNPSKVLAKIKTKLKPQIIGVETKTTSLDELIKEIEEL